MILPRDGSALLVVDIQERLLPTILHAERLVSQVCRLVRAAALLDVPVIITEQYRKGLGATDQRIIDASPTSSRIEKTTFSACGEPRFLSALRETGATHVLVVGVESHVCVAQTALDLIARGYTVHVALDAISAGNPAGDAAGRDRMRHGGALAATFESAVFDWMTDARHPRFKDVQELVKSARKEQL